jgi:transposase-like protein
MFEQENVMNGKAAGGVGERSEPQPPAERRFSNGEAPAKARRRQFTAAYKRRILAEVDRLKGDSGAIGALLRREGLYSSHVSNWRRQEREGGKQALASNKRGRKPKERNPLEPELRQLEKENRRLQKKLRQAELLIDLQKKVAAMLAEDDDEGRMS